MLLIEVQSGEDADVLLFARSETHRPGEQVTTLCGVETTMTREGLLQLAEYKRYKRTCLDCDTVWRKRANLAPHSALASS